MQIERHAAHAPRSRAIAARAAAVAGCIDCEDCRGMCRALLELLSVPEAVAKAA